MLKNLPLIIVLSASLAACGGDDNKKSSSSSSVALSSSSPAASSTPAASSIPASSTPASSMPASSEPASSTPASSEPASSTPASSMPAASSVATSIESSSSSSSSAAAKLSVNFESDAVDTLYESASWNPGELTATVVTIASVTGLPANGDSINVLKVVVGNYNAVPIAEVTLPAGKTLADYNVKVDAYFPRSTLGLTNVESNYYKDFMLLAGTSITSGAGDANPAYHSKISTIWDDVDVWKTYTLTVDATKGAALTGTLKIGMGLNRPAGTTDGYYFDNIRLELK